MALNIKLFSSLSAIRRSEGRHPIAGSHLTASDTDGAISDLVVNILI